MLTLAKNVIVARADNYPPMLDKTQYSSFTSRMLLYIRGKENKKLLIDSVLNGPFKYGTLIVLDIQTTPVTVKDKTYDELTDAEKIRGSCDIKATNIVLQGLPQDIYNLMNHYTKAKDIWDRVKLLTEDAHHSSVIHHQSYEAPVHHPSSQASFPWLDSGLVVPSFLPSDDPIASLNKAMSFISIAFTSRYPPTNNQLRISSNLRNQATIQDVAFQTDDLDAFGYDCDEAPSASVVLMAELSAYDSDVLSEAKEDKYLEKIIKLEMKKKALDNVVYKMGQSTQTMHMLTKPQVVYDEGHQTALSYQNPLYLTKAQRKVHSLYYGNTIVKQHDALSIIDTEETL
nr:hypothetical protein [Tanacetum cinerariifolium]